MPHDHHSHAHGHGHNHAGADHLHSHMHGPDRGEALGVLAEQFVAGFIAAADKTAYLRLAGVPFEMEDAGGGPGLKLVDVALRTEWQVGTASPGFGSGELNYLPYPGAMVRERSALAFVYVSLEKRVERDLLDFLAAHEAVAG
ncbi:MAG: hypothetical protein AAF371_01920 [Pseudomonadota bacterium]